MMQEIRVENRITPGAWAEEVLSSPSTVTLETQDGRLVAECPHAIGHTVAVTAFYFQQDSLTVDPFMHGCDGCCGGEAAK